MKKPDGTTIISTALLRALINIDPWVMQGKKTRHSEPQLICRACGGHMAWHGPEHKPDCVWCKVREILGERFFGRPVSNVWLAEEGKDEDN